MRRYGSYLFVVGVLLMIGAGFFPVSLPAPQSLVDGQVMANWDLMFQRQMIHQTGGFFLVAGAVLRAAAEIILAIKGEKAPEDKAFEGQV